MDDKLELTDKSKCKNIQCPISLEYISRIPNDKLTLMSDGQCYSTEHIYKWVKQLYDSGNRLGQPNFLLPTRSPITNHDLLKLNIPKIEYSTRSGKKRTKDEVEDDEDDDEDEDEDEDEYEIAERLLYDDTEERNRFYNYLTAILTNSMTEQQNDEIGDGEPMYNVLMENGYEEYYPYDPFVIYQIYLRDKINKIIERGDVVPQIILNRIEPLNLTINENGVIDLTMQYGQSSITLGHRLGLDILEEEGFTENLKTILDTYELNIITQMDVPNIDELVGELFDFGKSQKRKSIKRKSKRKSIKRK